VFVVLQTQYFLDDIRRINEVSVCHANHVVKYSAQPPFTRYKRLDNRLYCQLGQLSLASLWVSNSSTSFRAIGWGKGGNFISVGWQVTLV